jgi:hypothetical protein
MSETLELDPRALCVQCHDALKKDCPVCGAKADECCIEDGEELPVYAAHIGRATDGENLMVVHTGEYDEDGGAILRAVEN